MFFQSWETLNQVYVSAKGKSVHGYSLLWEVSELHLEGTHAINLNRSFPDNINLSQFPDLSNNSVKLRSHILVNKKSKEGGINDHFGGLIIKPRVIDWQFSRSYSIVGFDERAVMVELISRHEV